MNPVLAIIGPIGWPELVVILVLVLVVFGPKRLPEIAESFGKSIGKFRKATKKAKTEVKRELDAAAMDSREEESRGSADDVGTAPPPPAGNDTAPERDESR